MSLRLQRIMAPGTPLALVLYVLLLLPFLTTGCGDSPDPETPPGRELAQRYHDGEWYTMVEYGDKLAVFSASGSPVTDPGLAGEVLRSYAWGQALQDLDTGGMADAVDLVRDVDDRLSGLREASNEVVGVFDELDDLGAEVPLGGRVSAMDVLAETYPGVGVAAEAIRSLDSELNSIGRDTAQLGSTLERITTIDSSRESGDDMEPLFRDAAAASVDMESRARSAEVGVADVMVLALDLEEALWQASSTPLIGDAIGEAAGTASDFAAALSGLTDLLQEYADNLGYLAKQFRDAIDGADEAYRGLLGRWLQMPYDENWRSVTRSQPAPARSQAAATKEPTPVPTGSVVSATVQPAPTPTAPPVHESEPFRLDWEASASTVAVGEGFTLTVRMYEVQEAGEHGGISVSFPTLTESGGSAAGYSSGRAEVEALDFTSGLSNVAFHQPGATIYHREDNRQFPAEYLLVESDDPSWSHSDDRTLRLRITPKRGGELPVQIRGWLCTVEYTGCSRNPPSGPVEDQQGWAASALTIEVAQPTAEHLRAMEDCHRALPQDIESQVGSYRTPRDTDRYHRSIVACHSVIELGTADARTYVNIGYAYGGLKQYRRATEYLDLAIDLDSGYAMAYTVRGLAYIGLEKFGQAIEDFDRAIELAPSSARSYSNRGCAYIELEEWSRAIGDFDRAVELDPSYAMAYQNKGGTYMGLNEYGRAIEEFDRAIELDPNLGYAYINRGIAFSMIEGYGQAGSAFEREYYHGASLSYYPGLALAVIDSVSISDHDLAEYRGSRAEEDIAKGTELLGSNKN